MWEKKLYTPRSRQYEMIDSMLNVWSPCLHFHLWTILCQSKVQCSSSNPDPSSELWKWIFLIITKLINFIKKKVYTNFAFKERWIWKRWPSSLLGQCPNSCYSKSTDNYLPKMHKGSKSSPWQARGQHMSILHLDTWYMICHIKRNTVPSKRSFNRTCTNVPYPHPEQYLF